MRCQLLTPLYDELFARTSTFLAELQCGGRKTRSQTLSVSRLRLAWRGRRGKTGRSADPECPSGNSLRDRNQDPVTRERYYGWSPLVDWVLPVTGRLCALRFGKTLGLLGLTSCLRKCHESS